MPFLKTCFLFSTYENIVSEDERLLRESLETVNDEPLSIESNLTPKEEQNVLNDTGKEKDNRLSDNHSQSDAQNEVHDLPNFRRAVAVDVHRISQNPSVEATNCDENDVSSENDSFAMEQWIDRALNLLRVDIHPLSL